MQLDLFCRETDPETCVAPSPPARQLLERAVVGVFSVGRELTDEQLVTLLPQHHGPSVKSARSRMTNAGFLRDTGKKLLNERGRWVIVWGPA